MFKDTIKALRKEHGLTQTKLGEVVGFTHVAVVKWENGQREPDFSTLTKLADYFGVSTDYLLGREEKKSIMDRQTSEIAENFIREYGDLLKEKAFNDLAKLYKAVDIANRIFIVSSIVGYLNRNGVNTELIVGY